MTLLLPSLAEAAPGRSRPHSTAEAFSFATRQAPRDRADALIGGGWGAEARAREHHQWCPRATYREVPRTRFLTSGRKAALRSPRIRVTSERPARVPRLWGYGNGKKGSSGVPVGQKFPALFWHSVVQTYSNGAVTVAPPGAEHDTPSASASMQPGRTIAPFSGSRLQSVVSVRSGSLNRRPSAWRSGRARCCSRPGASRCRGSRPGAPTSPSPPTARRCCTTPARRWRCGCASPTPAAAGGSRVHARPVSAPPGLGRPRIRGVHRTPRTAPGR